jgi:hypothetical protein
MSPRILCCIAMICTLFLPVAGTREQVPHGKYVGPCRSLDLSSIPIVVVGTITSDQKVGQPERVTRDHSVAIYQWFKVGVHVENVLKGNIRSRDVDIYYLTNIGPIGGPHRLGLRANVPGGTWRIGKCSSCGEMRGFFAQSVTPQRLQYGGFIRVRIRPRKNPCRKQSQIFCLTVDWTAPIGT